MKYNVSLTGVFNTSEEEGVENVITVKQEVLLSEEVEALVEGLQSQIDTLEENLQAITQPATDFTNEIEKITELDQRLMELTELTTNLSRQLVALEEQLEAIKEEIKNEPTDPEEPTNPEDPSTPEEPEDDTYLVTQFGAIPNDNKSDLDSFTRCFNAAGNNTVVIPNGTFNLPWNTRTTFDYNRLLTCKGTGRISIDEFPQPGSRVTNFNPHLINTAYEDGFGRFNISRVTDDLYMSMNIPHEHRSVMNMYHQNYAGVKTRYNQNAAHPKFVPWGQFALRLDKSSGNLPSGNVTFNIGKFGLMIYRESTKKWEIQSNPAASDGGFFYKTYDQSTIALTKTKNQTEKYFSFTVPISKTTDYIVHYWSTDWIISNPTDVKYAIVFSDAWIDNKTPNLEEYFVHNLGLDMYSMDKKSINEFMTGRFIDMKYTKRRNYIHNIMEANYDSITGGEANINRIIDAKSYNIY